MRRFLVHVDGSCHPNPGGPGGWAAVIQETRELSGTCSDPTTNNRMELKAAIEALRFLTERAEVTIVTDSQYLQRGATEWIAQWKRRRWRNVKNSDLWREVDALCSQHEVRWTWIRSHQNNGNLNDRCDALANSRRLEANDSCKKQL